MEHVAMKTFEWLWEDGRMKGEQGTCKTFILVSTIYIYYKKCFYDSLKSNEL